MRIVFKIVFVARIEELSELLKKMFHSIVFCLCSLSLIGKFRVFMASVILVLRLYCYIYDDLHQCK